MFTMSCFISSNFFSGVVINDVFTTNISLIIFLFWKRIFSLLFNEDFHTRHLKYFLYFSVLLLKYFVSGVEIFQSYCWIGRHLYPDPKAASSYCGCFSFPHQRKEIIEAKQFHTYSVLQLHLLYLLGWKFFIMHFCDSVENISIIML